MRQWGVGGAELWGPEDRKPQSQFPSCCQGRVELAGACGPATACRPEGPPPAAGSQAHARPTPIVPVLGARGLFPRALELSLCQCSLKLAGF